MEQKKFAEHLISRFDQLWQEKSQWGPIYQDISDFVIPRRGSFSSPATNTPGRDLSLIQFDSTAPWAHEQLASGLHSFLSSTAQRWFRLALPRTVSADVRDSEEVKAWLQNTTDTMFDIFNMNKSNFSSQVHELYLDVSGFGTGVMFVSEEYAEAPVRFCTYHLANCVIDEDAWGRVDTVAVRIILQARQAIQEWGKALPADFILAAEKEPLKTFEFIHFVGPREDFEKDTKIPQKMRYGSWHIFKERGLIVKESGFQEFPFMVPRWSKLTGERYGRSPAMTCMSSIRMINFTTRNVAIAGHKMVEPQWLSPDEGLLSNIDNTPGSIIYYDSTMNPDHVPRPIDSKAQPQIGQMMIESLQKQVIRSFYVDWMNMPDGPQKTATEVVQRTEESMRMMAPATMRLQAELLDPMIDRVFAICQRAELFGETPKELENVNLRIEYVSPVVKAQRMTQVMGFMQMLQQLREVNDFMPGVLEGYDGDGVRDFFNDVFDTPTSLVMTKEELGQMRQDRAEQQQAMQQAEQANVDADSASKMGAAAANQSKAMATMEAA